MFTITNTETAGAAERELSTDRPGLEYRDFELAAPLPDKCEAACDEDNKCRAWTFAWPGKKGPRARCFLKSGLPPKKSDNCCISGIRTKPANPDESTASVPPSPEPIPEPPPQPAPQPQQSLEDACRDYAQTAMAQNAQNDELFCGFEGSRWGHHHDVYYNWCMTKSSDKSRADNTAARDRDLNECRIIIGIPEPKKPAPPRDVARDSACREYANRAVEQSEEATQLGCNFTGPRWLLAYQPHFAWCMSVGEAYHASEIAERGTALNNCRPKQQSLDAGCENYARAAFRLARQNRERRCGFTGPRWRRDIDVHKSWCIGARLLEREREQAARHKALAACSGGPREVNSCASYAQGAIKHAHDNLQHDCGFKGTRWRADYEPHFIWCMNATGQQRHAERTARIKSLLKCSGGMSFDLDEGLRLYRYRWKNLSQGASAWDSGWIKSGSRRECVHKVPGCRCGWQNYCTTFRDGDVALWWRNGCDNLPWKITCQVEER